MKIIENMCGSHKVIPQENQKSKYGETSETSGVSTHRPSRRSLVFTVEKEETVASNSQRPHSWSEKEITFLVVFIALYWVNSEVQETWPKLKKQGILECLCKTCCQALALLIAHSDKLSLQAIVQCGESRGIL